MIRQVEAGERWRLAELVAGWDYPRRITAREVECGTWLTNGQGVAWFIDPIPAGNPVPDGWDAAHTLSVHAIGDPSVRRRGVRIMTPRVAVALEVIAELLGATKLYSLIPDETPNMPVAAMRRYLRRFGWLEDDYGSYKLLGGT